MLLSRNYQGLSGITRDYPWIIKDYQGLLVTTRGCQGLPVDYHGLSGITRDYPGIIKGYQGAELLSIDCLGPFQAESPAPAGAWTR